MERQQGPNDMFSHVLLKVKLPKLQREAHIIAMVACIDSEKKLRLALFAAS